MSHLLNPWFVVGLIDGEGCFCITVSRHKTKRLGLDPRLMFEVEMIIEDKPLLERLQAFFNCGSIYELKYTRYGWRPHAKFAVKSHKDIVEKIVPFFEKYPLQSKKAKDFAYFCEAVELFKQKEHLSIEGINKLRQIQSRMNMRKKDKWSSAKVRENRAPGGDRDTSLVTMNDDLRTPPVKSAKLGAAEPRVSGGS